MLRCRTCIHTRTHARQTRGNGASQTAPPAPLAWMTRPVLATNVIWDTTQLVQCSRGVSPFTTLQWRRRSDNKMAPWAHYWRMWRHPQCAEVCDVMWQTAGLRGMLCFADTVTNRNRQTDRETHTRDNMTTPGYWQLMCGSHDNADNITSAL